MEYNITYLDLQALEAVSDSTVIDDVEYLVADKITELQEHEEEIFQNIITQG